MKKVAVGAACVVAGFLCMQMLAWMLQSIPPDHVAESVATDTPSGATAVVPQAESVSGSTAKQETISVSGQPVKATWTQPPTAKTTLFTPSPTSFKTSATTTPASKGTTSTKASPKTKRPTEISFTTQNVNKNGVPSRVLIQNTPAGTLTVLLAGANTTTGDLFVRKGTASMQGKRFPWEVRVARGVVSVTFDGVNVRQTQ